MEIKNVGALKKGIELEDLIAGQLIKAKRKEAGMTLTELGEKSQFTAGHLSGVENIGGNSILRSITTKTLRRIVTGLGLNYLEFRQEVRDIEAAHHVNISVEISTMPDL
jgi:transcriptional regulator with XRE-family HTH domain